MDQTNPTNLTSPTGASDATSIQGTEAQTKPFTVACIGLLAGGAWFEKEILTRSGDLEDHALRMPFSLADIRTGSKGELGPDTKGQSTQTDTYIKNTKEITGDERNQSFFLTNFVPPEAIEGEPVIDFLPRTNGKAYEHQKIQSTDWCQTRYDNFKKGKNDDEIEFNQVMIHPSMENNQDRELKEQLTILPMDPVRYGESAGEAFKNLVMTKAEPKKFGNSLIYTLRRVGTTGSGITEDAQASQAK